MERLWNVGHVFTFCHSASDLHGKLMLTAAKPTLTTGSNGLRFALAVNRRATVSDPYSQAATGQDQSTRDSKSQP